MTRVIHVSYDEIQPTIGHITFLIDDEVVCKLRNHESCDAEIDEGEHIVKAKLGFLRLFNGTVTAGENDWQLYTEQSGTNAGNAGPAKFKLCERKPINFYGKKI